MFTIPNVPHMRQITPYDCWHACLRMMTKWKNAGVSEPQGTHTDWLYQRCLEAGRIHYAQQRSAESAERHGRGSKRLDRVEMFSAQQELPSPGGTPFKPFGKKPGMTSALMPALLSENKLCGVRGDWLNNPLPSELAEGPGDIKEFLSRHGPLFCCLQRGHVVVVVGINNQNKLVVNDPEFDSGYFQGYALEALSKSPCVARCA